MTNVQVTHLIQGDNSQTSGAKFVIDGSFLDDYLRATSTWLKEVRALDLIDPVKSLRMPHKKILQGILSKQRDRKVVVKISDTQENLENPLEWQAYNIIAVNKVPGFVEYLGFFKCNDQLARVISDGLDNKGMCDGAGDSMQVLVMEYVANPSMKRYDWSKVPIDTLRSCVLQTIYTLLEAYLACQFVHGDMHLDNILLKQGSNSSITYDRCGVELISGSLEIALADLELSSVRKPVRSFFADVRNLFFKLYSDLGWCVVEGPLNEAYRTVRSWIEDGNEDPMSVKELAILVNRVEFQKGISSKSYDASDVKEGGGQPKHRLPRVSKTRISYL